MIPSQTNRPVPPAPGRNSPGCPSELAAMLASLGIDLPCSENVGILGERVRIGNCEVGNRMVALPMEGCDCRPDGAPSAITLRRYTRIAAGGSGTMWFEAAAVTEAGRSNPKSMWITPGNLDAFKRMVDDVRVAAARAGNDPVLCLLQLTHAGRFARMGLAPAPAVTHRVPELDRRQGFDDTLPLVSDAWLNELQGRFVEAARLARAAGFDGVDVKSCHGYLFSALLGAHRRAGMYGGSYENRTRMLRQTAARIGAEVDGCLVAVRFNAWDALAYPYGWGTSQADPAGPDLIESVRLAGDLAAGGVDLLGVSAGIPRIDPHINRPSAHYGGACSDIAEHPLVGIKRMTDMTGTIQRAAASLPVVAAGLAWLGTLMPRVAAGILTTGGATLIGQGRGTFAYPESVGDILSGRGMDQRKICVSCSQCSALMKLGGPAGCAVRDPAVYSFPKERQ